jgi:uncharacterized membrane protein HdeD (DUF308 family)
LEHGYLWRKRERVTLRYPALDWHHTPLRFDASPGGRRAADGGSVSRSSSQPGSRWWLGIAAGLLTFLTPGLTALVLLFFIAGWAIVTGVFEIIGAIELRKEIDNEWLLILGGIISVLFGVGMMLAPGAGALALVWVIGAYSVVMGVLFVALAFRLKKHTHS